MHPRARLLKILPGASHKRTRLRVEVGVCVWRQSTRGSEDQNEPPKEKTEFFQKNRKKINGVSQHIITTLALSHTACGGFRLISIDHWQACDWLHVHTLKGVAGVSSSVETEQPARGDPCWFSATNGLNVHRGTFRSFLQPCGRQALS